MAPKSCKGTAPEGEPTQGLVRALREASETRRRAAARRHECSADSDGARSHNHNHLQGHRPPHKAIYDLPIADGD